MKEIGVYSGDVNSMMDLDFAKAVQRYYDEFINRCKAGFESSLMCTALKPTWKNSGKILMPPVSIVIGDAGSDNLKKEADKMKISD